MRQTKRRRTRDTACQTLTYRELRDMASTATLGKHSGSMRWKSGIAFPNPPEGGAQQPRLRQRYSQQQQQQQRLQQEQQEQQEQHPEEPHQHPRRHEAPPSFSMFNPPGSPLSSAATASPASVYRTTDEGGIVHGAIVRGSRGGQRKQQQRQPAAQRQQARPEAGVGAAGSTATAATRPQDHRGGPATRAVAPTTESRGGDGVPFDGHRAPAGSLPESRPEGRRRGGHNRKKQGLAGSATGSFHRPETVSDQRLSPPPLGQVSVSWGQEPETGEAAAAERGVAPPLTARDAPAAVVVPGYIGGGRGPHAFRGDRAGGDWNAENEDSESRLCAAGGFGYEPLSKGPDYRKVGPRLRGMRPSRAFPPIALECTVKALPARRGIYQEKNCCCLRCRCFMQSSGGSLRGSRGKSSPETNPRWDQAGENM